MVEAEAPPSPEDRADQLEMARAKAESDGYAEGYARGREAGESALAEQAARIAQMIDGAKHDVRETLLQLEPQVIELAMIVARRVIEREVAEHPDLVVDVIRAGLIAAANLPVVRVRVHPNDHQLVATVWASIQPASADPPVELVPDPQIEAGGCIIDTASGFVDAQPSARLNEIRNSVLPFVDGNE